MTKPLNKAEQGKGLKKRFKSTEPKYTAWRCSKCNLVGEMMSQEEVDEHLAGHKLNKLDYQFIEEEHMTAGLWYKYIVWKPADESGANSPLSFNSLKEAYKSLTPKGKEQRKRYKEVIG